MKRTAARSFAQIFVAPAAVAVVSLAGLVVALLGDGWLDVVSWAALTTPLVVAAWALRVRRS